MKTVLEYLKCFLTIAAVLSVLTVVMRVLVMGNLPN